MPTVPWIRLYQNWPRHRKTMALRKALGTAEPILCLWLWAAENAPDGDFDGMTTDEIEDASEWQGKRGKAVSAMVEAGFIDVDPSTGAMRLHNWQTRAGAGVANLERRRAKAAERMRNVRANKTRTGCARSHEQDANGARTGCERAAHVAETLSLSPDLGLSGSSLPEADPDPERARSNGNARPTGFDLLNRFGIERAKVFPSTLPWVTARDAKGDAGSFAAGLPDEVLGDVIPTMRLALEHIRDGVKGWTDSRMRDPSFAFGAWKSGFHGLREELHGATPPTKTSTGDRIEQDQTRGHIRATTEPPKSLGRQALP